MNEKFFIGRQPILDLNENIFAYEILFRSTDANYALIDNNLSATSSVLLNLLQNFGIDTLLGSKKGFINVNELAINEDIISLLPPDKTVLEILETTNVTNPLIEKIQHYVKKNYSFALDDYVFSPEYAANFNSLLKEISFIKIDLRSTSKRQILNNMKELKSLGINLLAEKVETQEEFQFCKNAGFQYFQGYYFAKPSVVSTKKAITPNITGVIELINILKNEPNSLDLFIKEMKKHPEVSFNLLKFINSSAFLLKSNIDSIKHAAALLGINNLSKWLMLFLYAFKGNISLHENPLMQTARERASTMENLALKIDPKQADKAYLTGLVSLLDVIMEAPFETFIDSFNISSEIKNTILGKETTLSKLLNLTVMLERCELNGSEEILKELNITLSDAADARNNCFIIKEK